jgi:hypothetical protein
MQNRSSLLLAVAVCAVIVVIIILHLTGVLGANLHG